MILLSHLSLKYLLPINALELATIAFTFYRLSNNTQYLITICLYCAGAYFTQSVSMIFSMNSVAQILLMVAIYGGVTLGSAWFFTKYQNNLEIMEDKLFNCRES